MPTVILGIGGYSHDSSATLIIDGVVIAAAEEERFTRLKHQAGFPHKAIEYCLAQGKVSLEDVNHIAFYMHLRSGIFKRIFHHIRHFKSYPTFSIGYIIEQLYRRGWAWFELERLKKQAGGKAEIHYIPHHLAHASTSYFVSGYKNAAALVIDGMGEWTSLTIATCKDNTIRKLSEVEFPSSLGAFYGSVTNHLGFKTGDEYKVMGLASYGEPTYVNEMRRLLDVHSDGTFHLDMDYFTFHKMPGRYEGYVSEKFLEIFGPSRIPDDPISENHMNIAASLQAVLEETCLKIADKIHGITSESNLVISGGVALNSAMNGKVRAESKFANVFIPPSPGDAGTSLGAAFYVWGSILGQKTNYVMQRADLGPEYSIKRIENALIEAKIRYEFCDDVAAKAAEIIADGKILGWFQGRMEWGPRALGHRSILADPTNPEMTNIVNAHVKHREDFRPFAPSILEEYGDEYFKDYHTSPFMIEILRSKPIAKSTIPAVVHIDGTSRVQTVNKTLNPLYWATIDEFRKIKGVPAVLNTSFNVRGEPIVNTPEDAIRCFYSTGIDALFLGSFLISKEGLDSF